jgi:antitoxin component YwqK of YwqJK toxin-antitoxin module
MKSINKTVVKLGLLLLIFSFPIIGSTQVNKVDDQGRKQGEWVKYYKNRTVPRYKGQFVNDKPVGKFTYYYASNDVRSIVIHDKNSNRSEAFFYHDNETLMAHGIFIGQKKDSVWTNYLPTGHISFKETYSNGELNGLKTTYYGPDVAKKGQKIVLRKALYKEGRLNGKFTEYFPYGTLKAKGIYKDGKYEGVIIKNHPNGKPMLKERWKSREKHGWWITYDKSGKEIGRAYFLHGDRMEGKKLDEYMQELKKKGISPNK